MVCQPVRRLHSNSREAGNAHMAQNDRGRVAVAGIGAERAGLIAGEALELGHSLISCSYFIASGSVSLTPSARQWAERASMYSVSSAFVIALDTPRISEAKRAHSCSYVMSTVARCHT